jgi:hypothetical protein
MSRLFVWAAVVCVTVSAQARPPAPPAAAPAERPALKDHQYEVVVSGCIRDKRIERAFIQSPSDDLPFNALNASTFVLDGPKELLKQIADEHKNHLDQVVGIATVPPSMNRAQSAVKSKRVGPIDIGIGGRQETSAIQSVPQPIKLKVSSLVHVQDGCTAR